MMRPWASGFWSSCARPSRVSVPLVPSRIIWWIVEGGQGVRAPRGTVTLAGASELREESMAGDWLQVWAPLGLVGWLVGDFGD